MQNAAGARTPIPAELRYRLAELILAESARAGLGRVPGCPPSASSRRTWGRPARRSGTRWPCCRRRGISRARSGAGRSCGRTAGTDAAGGGHSGCGRGRRPPRSAAGARGRPGRPRPGRRGAPAGFAPADVMTIRRLLEPLAMPLVVAWATASDFREMDRCLAGGDRAASYDEFENWDLALHRTIMAASHSPLLGQLYAVIETARHGHSWGDLKRRSASRDRRESTRLIMPSSSPRCAPGTATAPPRRCARTCPGSITICSARPRDPAARRGLEEPAAGVVAEQGGGTVLVARGRRGRPGRPRRRGRRGRGSWASTATASRCRRGHGPPGRANWTS